MNSFMELPIQENHPIVLLDELCDLCSGITKGRKIDSMETDNVPYMAVANVQDGKLRLDNVKTIEATPVEIERYRLQPGDLLLTEGGDPDKLGRGAIWNGEIDVCIHQNHIFRARKASERIDMGYLAHLVSSAYGKQYFLRQSKQTTGIASINMGQLKRFPVPLPPLEEQRRIVAILDKASFLQAKSAEGMKLLENLGIERLEQLLSDHEEDLMLQRLEDLCIPDSPITYGILQPGPDLEDGIPYVLPSEIKGSQIEVKKLRKTSLDIARRYQKSELRSGDILFTIVGTIGEAAIVPPELEGANITQSSSRIRVNPSAANSSFVYYYLKSQHAKRQISRDRLGVAVERLNLHHVRDMEILCLPRPIQDRFAEEVQSLRSLGNIWSLLASEVSALSVALKHSLLESQ